MVHNYVLCYAVLSPNGVPERNDQENVSDLPQRWKWY